MPQEVENFFMKARIKALTFERHINLVSVVTGKLVVDPIDIPAATMKTLRRSKATWTPDKRKPRLPLKHFAAENDSQLLEAILEFLKDLTD